MQHILFKSSGRCMKAQLHVSGVWKLIFMLSLDATKEGKNRRAYLIIISNWNWPPRTRFTCTARFPRVLREHPLLVQTRLRVATLLLSVREQPCARNVSVNDVWLWRNDVDRPIMYKSQAHVTPYTIPFTIKTFWRTINTGWRKTRSSRLAYNQYSDRRDCRANRSNH